ncbi:MAG: excinuclease ABC subunit UvrC [Zoogloeaceae bacterium]|nr:excinuclease ABC subunit UvrC [Zoogloeaceae bacterium]MCK6383582.1 excinuclease ABC subunit UvrC [Rhodocyclaceae bacterium]
MFDSKALIRSLPEEPGVYRMLDAAGQVLYVGKAKALKKRVATYFQKASLSPRIRLMVGQVASVEVTATRSEAEALILENNLIKRLAPKFNILFRDDKSYPYIELSADACPRIAFHRGAFDKGARYFGPFPNVQAVRESIHLLQRVFLLRTCENPVFQNRSRPCLLHQIGRCSAPCVGLISEADYAADVHLAEMFLKGRHGEVIERLTEAMQAEADKLHFEKAAALRDQIRSLQKVLHRQYVESAREEDVDIVAAVAERGMLVINHAMVRGGRHLGDKAHFPQNAQDCAPEEALTAFLEQHYADHPAPPRILVNLDMDTECEAILGGMAGHAVALQRPRHAMERAWLAMAEKNARHAIEAQSMQKTNAEGRLDRLREALGSTEALRRIECFDISHTLGEAAVASCVVCVDGILKKSEYRRYNIAGILPGDDYAAMRQALERRYEKVAAGEGVRPDLILIDGGKGQVGAARGVLSELGLADLPAVGVAKGEERKPGQETLFLPCKDEPLNLPASDPALHLIQLVRDEAHRFAIAGHRARRAKTRNRSTLEDIPGIGPARRKRLLAQFGGLQGLRTATVEDLCRVDGISRKLAEAIYNHLH